MPGPPLPGQQLSQPLLAAISAWRELGALSSESWLTWVGSEGRASLRSLRPSASLRKTDRQGQHGQRQKEGHPGRDLLSSSPSYPGDVAHRASIRNEEDCPQAGKAPCRGSGRPGGGVGRVDGTRAGIPASEAELQTLPQTTPPPPFPGPFSVDPGPSQASVSPSTQKYMEPRSRLDGYVP